MTRHEYEEIKRSLQIELLKLQSWVKDTGQKVVAALRGPGRGRQGRHDQAVHRAPQPARRPGRRAGQAHRARAHPVVLPALRRAPADGGRDRAVRPLLVQPGRRRAGDGLLHPGRVPGVHAPGPGVRADAGAQRHPPDQVLVLGVPRRAAHPVRIRREIDPVRQWKLEPDGPGVAGQVGRLHRGQGGHVLLHRHRRRAVDGDQEQRQEAGPDRGAALRAAHAWTTPTRTSRWSGCPTR